jgi:uncharacterized protein YcbX
MPSVTRFSIAPVRSLGLQHPTEIDLTEVGVVEDRRFYLIDDDERLIDRIIAGELVQVAASTDPGATRLTMTLPDGTVLDDEVKLGEHVRTPIHDRWGEGRIVLGPWAKALEPFAGRPIRIVRCDRPGGTRVGNPTSLVSEGSVAELARQARVDSIDARRFRMLIEMDGLAAHEEDTWVGHRVRVGGAVLAITKPDARCAITTQDPDTGKRDLDTLRTIIGYRGLREGKHADFGILGDVVEPGRVRIGDEVDVLDPA